jgi:dATP pyrophosphohydrolase
MFEKFASRAKSVGVLYVDLYPYFLDEASGEPLFLLLKRRGDGELQDSWQAISGKIKESEKIRHAFIRQLKEKTGLVPLELYKLDHVSMFYDDYYDTVMLVPNAICRVASMDVTLDCSVHVDFKWVRVAETSSFVVWDNQLQVLATIEALVRNPGRLSKFHRLSLD